MSAALIERNRRAVYTALSGVCADRLLLERALAFWEAGFASQGVFRVAHYIDGLMGHIGLSQDQRRTLSVALYASLNKKEQELAELPAMFRKADSSTGAASPRPQAPGETPTAGQTRAVARNAGAVVLARILSAMVDGAARAGQHEDLIATLRDHGPAFGSAATSRAVDEWIAGSLADSQRLADRVSDAERRAIVNGVYVVLCEVSGPVSADRILARAVEAAEQLAEAVSFPPRSLL